MDKATFGAGCFWGVEAAFRQVKGVLATAVGYSGGHLSNPTYKDVCSGRTGHAEVVQVDYDPAHSREKAQSRFRNKIVTEITPASEFYRAEDYHQQYLEKRGLAHCSIRS